MGRPLRLSNLRGFHVNGGLATAKNLRLLASSIKRISVVIELCLGLRLLWKAGFAFVIFHA